MSERNHVKVLGTVPIIWGAISSHKLLLAVLCKVLTIVKFSELRDLGQVTFSLLSLFISIF